MSENQSSKYVLYALGEIFLVVIGILIALQINNWNEERVEQRKVSEFAQALVKDLENDLLMVEPIITQMRFVQEQINGLAAYMEGKSIEQVRNIDLVYFMHSPYYRPYAWNRTAMEQIKASGALTQMQNREIAEKISAYDALTRHLDEDFAYDREIGTNASAHAHQVVDSNYPNMVSKNFPGGMTFQTLRLRLLEDFEDTHRPLLTDDINEIRKAVNYFIELGGGAGIEARVEIEMPRLVSSAEELIAMLREEYPE